MLSQRKYASTILIAITFSRLPQDVFQTAKVSKILMAINTEKLLNIRANHLMKLNFRMTLTQMIQRLKTVNKIRRPICPQKHQLTINPKVYLILVLHQMICQDLATFIISFQSSWLLKHKMHTTMSLI